MTNFKPGDWVIVNNSFENIIKVEYEDYEEDGIETRIFIDNSEEYYGAEDVEIWQPKPGEWCWFWDEQYTTAILAKFIEKTDEGYFEHHGNSFEYCEPFIGTLPSHLKNNK